MPDPSEPLVERAILFADVAGSTALYRDLGDVKGEALVNGAVAAVGRLAGQHGGRLIKTIGDCALCEFDTAQAAADTALQVQRQARAATLLGPAAPAFDRTMVKSAASPLSVRFRIGFTFGPVIYKEGDVFGNAVNIASHLCDLAKADQILTTEASAAVLSGEAGASIRPFDKTTVKGTTEELAITQLLWDRQTSATTLFLAPSEPAVPAVCVLRIFYAGQTRSLTGDDLPFTIGRGADCDLIVPAPFASRCHLRIELKRSKFCLIDESTNGTYLVPDAGAPERPIYVRNEQFTLIGGGMFALGVYPNPQDPHVLRYSVPL
jgi:class 3 adenylate cyclase